MAKGKKRQKIRDKWRLKKWLIVKSPPPFGGDIIANVPVTNENKAIGKVLETTLFDILQEDPQHYSIKLSFQIDKVEGDIAQTIFKGHEYSREYLRSLIRRGLTSIRLVNNYNTRDQAVVQAQITVITQNRINTSKKHSIRLIINEVLMRKASELTYNQFAQEAVLGKLASDIYNSAKSVSRLRHVGISKTKIISKPKIEIEDIEILQNLREEKIDKEIKVDIPAEN